MRSLAQPPTKASLRRSLGGLVLFFIRRLDSITGRTACYIPLLQIIKNHKSGQSRLFGFVTFITCSGAKAAIRAMNGKRLNGSTLRVDFSFTKKSHKPRRRTYEHQCTSILPKNTLTTGAGQQGTKPKGKAVGLGCRLALLQNTVISPILF